MKVSLLVLVSLVTRATGSLRGGNEATDSQDASEMRVLKRRMMMMMVVTKNPTGKPTLNAQPKPTPKPSPLPTPSPVLGATPTGNPIANPTGNPIANPTANPIANPTANPTANPIANPTSNPTGAPTGNPTGAPTTAPTTRGPTALERDANGYAKCTNDGSSKFPNLGHESSERLLLREGVISSIPKSLCGRPGNKNVILVVGDGMGWYVYS